MPRRRLPCSSWAPAVAVPSPACCWGRRVSRSCTTRSVRWPSCDEAHDESLGDQRAASLNRGPGEVLVEVHVCGVCRTDPHVTDGDLARHRSPVVPGHEVVGTVVGVGGPDSRFQPGDRVGIAWLRRTCGECRWCRSGAENLCPRSEYTGWDEDGGYAEYAVVPAAFADRIPEALSDEQAAPLVCSGIIGYRALRGAAVPPGGRLGIYGFGVSAHITAQTAIAQGMEVHVLTRDKSARALALPRRCLGGRHVRRAAGASGLGDPLRARRRPRPGGAGCPRSRRHPCRRRYPPQRHPAAELPGPAVPGAHVGERHVPVSYTHLR